MVYCTEKPLGFVAFDNPALCVYNFSISERGRNTMKTAAVSENALDRKRSFLYNLFAVPDLICRSLPHLDNCMIAQDEPDVGDLEGEPTMEKLRRARVTVDHDEQGSPIVKWASGKTSEELHYNISRILFENGCLEDMIRNHKPKAHSEPTSQCVSFRVHTEQWLKLYKAQTLKPTTLAGYRSNLKCHIYPALGDIPLDRITTADIQKFLNEHANLARSTLHTMQILVGEILQSAFEDSLIPTNPASSKRLCNPSSGKKTREALELGILKEIVHKIPLLEDQEDICLMALLTLTGMRRGEVLGLRWEDIDFDAGLIHVRRSVTYPSNRPNVSTPKSKNGYRDVPIPPQLHLLLFKCRSSGYVVGGEVPISKQTFRNSMTRIEKQIDLHGATPHVFRHTLMTMFDRAGVGAKTIQAIAGHGDIKITMNRYVHSQTDQLLSAGEKIGALLTFSASNE